MKRRAWLTFVVVGGGPTGVELAGQLGEIAHQALSDEFESAEPRSARIMLVEGLDRILTTYRESLSQKAVADLAELGVTVRTGTMVTAIDADGVTVQRGDTTERIEARTVLWGAGVRASPLGEMLASATGLPVDRSGRIPVDDHLRLPGHPDVFVIGDMAAATDASGLQLPGVAPVAIQQGQYVARAIRAELETAGERAAGAGRRPFRFKERGTMATIGRGRAVVELRGIPFDGFLAWMLWLVVHVMYLVAFQSRVIVTIRWTWLFFTRRRPGLLLTPDRRDPVALAAAFRGPDPSPPLDTTPAAAPPPVVERTRT